MPTSPFLYQAPTNIGDKLFMKSPTTDWACRFMKHCLAQHLLGSVFVRPNWRGSSRKAEHPQPGPSQQPRASPCFCGVIPFEKLRGELPRSFQGGGSVHYRTGLTQWYLRIVLFSEEKQGATNMITELVGQGAKQNSSCINRSSTVDGSVEPKVASQAWC